MRLDCSATAIMIRSAMVANFLSQEVQRDNTVDVDNRKKRTINKTMLL